MLYINKKLPYCLCWHLYLICSPIMSTSWKYRNLWWHWEYGINFNNSISISVQLHKSSPTPIHNLSNDISVLLQIHTNLLNYIYIKLWNIIMHQCRNFNGNFTKLPLKLGHECVLHPMEIYRQLSNMRHTKSRILNARCLILQLSLFSPPKLGIESRLKM